MEYSRPNDTGEFQGMEEDNLPHKKQKIDNSWHYQSSNESVDKLIKDWISEYKTWYEITFGPNNCPQDDSNDNYSPKISNPISNYNKDHIHFSSGSQFCSNTLLPPQLSSRNYFHENSPQHIIPLQNINQDTIFYPLHKNNKTKHRQPNIGYWGPLLRYGTYGVYKRYKKSINLNRTYPVAKDANNLTENGKIILSYPLDLPLRIKIPRQAMICTLQAKLKSRLYDLRKIEKDPVLHMTINYANNLEQVTKTCGTCPKYLYTRVNNLPTTEREYFTCLDHNYPLRKFLSIDGSLFNTIKLTNDFYACELLIGDIIISQGFALWKRRAREVCARNAFAHLENPCYLVGSTRFWYDTDYMTACTTTDPTVAPILPPFLTDPTEPLYKKDEKINESDPEENFDILNPKSLHDFWLYATTLKENENIKNIDPQMLLYQSAEFSQMNLSFEVESCWDQSFACTVMIDKSPAIKVEGLGSLEQACQAAALVLVDRLVDTQPIVVINETYHQQYFKLENDSDYKDNSFLVRSLMWAQHDFESPIDFKDLSSLITPETFLSITKLQTISSQDLITNEKDLEYFFNIYAQSSLVNPLRMDKMCLIDELWTCIPHKVRKIGLIIMNEPIDNVIQSVLICKQIPHTKLKALLMRDRCFGVFTLLNEGNLPDTYLEMLNQFIYYDNNENDDNNNAQDSFIDHLCDKNVQITDSNESTFVSGYRSVYKDLINDIPQDLIPGLDF